MKNYKGNSTTPADISHFTQRRITEMKAAKLDTQIAKLEQQIEAEHARYKAAVFDAIGAVLVSYGLSLEDLAETPKPAVKKKVKVDLPVKEIVVSVKAKKTKTPATSKGTKPPKYRDPESGKTWSGMGHTPQWMVAAKNRDAYLINGAG
jgi:DNA-binding protein H-NS